MAKITENELLSGLRNNDDGAFTTLYQTCFPTVKRYIIQNNGCAEDAEDNFQESIIVLFNKVNSPDFILGSSLKTYLFAISRNLWLKKLRDSKLKTTNDIGSIDDNLPDPDLLNFELVPETTQEEHVNNWLSKISELCKVIVKAIFFHQEPMHSLMIKMGWKNRHTADNQKYKCLQQVKKQAAKDFR